MHSSARSSRLRDFIAKTFTAPQARRGRLVHPYIIGEP